MKYDFDRIPERRSTESCKWRVYEDDVIPLWVADMDFNSPEPIIRALHERVEQGIFGYPENVIPDSCGMLELRQIIVDRLADRYGWEVKPEDLLFIPGVVTGFNLACHLFASQGGEALVETPVYHPILEAPSHAGLARRDVELVRSPDGSYSVDLEAFEPAIGEQSRLFILCNPHNPVGRVFRQQELERMAEICLRHGLVICSDEIHCDLVYPGYRHIPLASLDPEIAQNTITLMAPTKTFNIPGLQCSIAIIQNPSLREKYLQAGQGLVSWVNLMGLVATRAAYLEGQDWLDQLLVYLEGNRDYLYEYVSQELPGIRMAKPEGTYLAWLDCRQAACSENPYEFFLEKARVAFSDGAIFGQAGKGFVRLNFGCPRSLLAEALGRMKAALRAALQGRLSGS